MNSTSLQAFVTGIGLFVIDVAAAGEGLAIRPYPTVDGRRAAEVALDGLVLPADALLAAHGHAWRNAGR